jgi:CheY-like chemotaxis protein
MNYRVLIFDDQLEMQKILWSFFDGRGYEVFTFPHPGACPLSEEALCPCSIEESCTDIILSDMNMPVKNGLDFLGEQLAKGCKCKHLALMSGDFWDEDVLRAKSLGLKIFKKPFKLRDMSNWLDQIENDIDPKRKLSDWFLKRMPQRSKE